MIVDSTNPVHSASCILRAGLGFSGDAFLHPGEVPSVQVSPHHRRPSDNFPQGSIFGTPDKMSFNPYIGFSERHLSAD